MFINTPQDYLKVKATARYPALFPDEDRWGNYEGFNYPILICPACGYKVFQGHVQSHRHLIYHCPYLIGEAEKVEEESEKEDSDEEEPEEPKKPVEEPKEPPRAPVPPEEPERLPLLEEKVVYREWEEIWQRMEFERKKKREEEADWWGKDPMPPEENDFVSFFPLIPEIGMRASREIACLRIQAALATPKEDNSWGDDDEPEPWRRKKNLKLLGKKKNK